MTGSHPPTDGCTEYEASSGDDHDIARRVPCLQEKRLWHDISRMIWRRFNIGIELVHVPDDAPRYPPAPEKWSQRRALKRCKRHLLERVGGEEQGMDETGAAKDFNPEGGCGEKFTEA